MLSTNQIQDISYLHYALPGATRRYIASKAQCSHQSVGRIVSALDRAGVGHSDIKNMANNEIMSLLHQPKQYKKKCRKIDFERIAQTLFHKKKSKYRATITQIYLEYVEQDPKTAYSKSHFFAKVKEFTRQYTATMRQLRRYGELLNIDYAGMQVFYFENGIKRTVCVFVACMGFSKKLFAIATPSQKSKDWIHALECALRYYDGVAEVIQFDNASPMVTKSGLIPVLHANAKALADHHECFCDTSRPAHSQDNADAEGGVKYITLRVLQVMRCMKFFSLEELNAFLFKEVEKLNNTPMQKCGQTRSALFEQYDKAELKPLNERPFEIIEASFSRLVPKTYLVNYKHHEYSVPYTLIGRKVEIRITQNQFKCFYDNKLRAEHPLSEIEFGITRDKTHMPAAHQAELDKGLDSFVEWAKTIDNLAVEWVKRQFENVKSKQSRYAGKRCIALKKLYSKTDIETFIRALEYALSQDMTTPSDLKLIIGAKPWATKEISDAPAEMHKNVRGGQYFVGGRHEA